MISRISRAQPRDDFRKSTDTGDRDELHSFEVANAGVATGCAPFNVDDISFPDGATCTQANLPSLCAQVTYDILG